MRKSVINKETVPATRTLIQYSGIEAFDLLEYDGSLTVNEILKQADFGLGCFNALDGELILFDGKCFHATADGSLKRAVPKSLISCAYFTQFNPSFQQDISSQLTSEDLVSIVKKLHKHLGQPFCALRLDGLFERINVRSVPPQKKPYAAIEEVVKNQAIFTYRHVQATMIGFYFPSYLSGLTYPGFHLHFITEDIKHGGHVLDFTLQEGRLEHSPLEAYSYILPDYARSNL